MISNGKIFGIGAPKTGTTSLGYALKMLGFKHKSWNRKLNQKYNEGDYESIFCEAENYDSFDDGPWNRREFYKELDQRFPGSKFILTVRELQSWSKSYEKHSSAAYLLNNPQKLWKRDYDENKKAEAIAQYKQRNESVFEYLKDRPEDLLVIDICSGEGWEKLCPFLGLPMRTDPFPSANNTVNRDLSTMGLWKQIIKRTLYRWKKVLKRVILQSVK